MPIDDYDDAYDPLDEDLRLVLRNRTRGLPGERPGAPGPNPIASMLALADALTERMTGASDVDPIVPVDDGEMPVSELRGGPRRC